MKLVLCFLTTSFLACISLAQEVTTACSSDLIGTHGCPARSGLTAIIENTKAGRVGDKSCNSGKYAFEFPAKSGNFVCYDLPSREAWNVYKSRLNIAKNEVRQPSSVIPTEEKLACLEWARKIKPDFNECN